MSTEGLSNDVSIEDEEGFVDRTVKQHVLNLRMQLDEDERLLYVDRMSHPDPAKRLKAAEANEYWGVSVRQYLRGLKRLWTKHEATDVRGVTEYWQEKVIGEETLLPPDTQEYRFSMVGYLDDGVTEWELKRELGLPKRSELPKPHVVEFRGLMSVLNNSRMSHSWHVKTNMEGPPPNHETVPLHVEMPIPKHILENAVEAADNFLQQAGLGFEVGVPDYYGGNEPGL